MANISKLEYTTCNEVSEESQIILIYNINRRYKIRQLNLIPNVSNLFG
jgi:hypothetical protein